MSRTLSRILVRGILPGRTLAAAAVLAALAAAAQAAPAAESGTEAKSGTAAKSGLEAKSESNAKPGSESKSDGGAPALTPEAIEGARFAPAAGQAGPTPAGKSDSEKADASGKSGGSDGPGEPAPDPLIVKAQALLDRARFSPGAIDGLVGDNFRGALSAFAVAQGLPAARALDAEVWGRLSGTSDAPVLTRYTVTEADAGGPYTVRIPHGMEAQAELDRLGYTDAREMLAERFHMSPDLLDALNPGASPGKAGTVLTVIAVEAMGTDKPKAADLPFDPRVERVVVQKESRAVRAFGADGKLLAYYPASIGSEAKPAPSGDTTVKGVAFDPTYTYDPKYSFKGVSAEHRFSIPPGPNNPVGLVWIDLAIPSYGIHGTPDPEKIGKTESHGCIRLTNWGARDLAAHVARGAKVSFKDE